MSFVKGACLLLTVVHLARLKQAGPPGCWFAREQGPSSLVSRIAPWHWDAVRQCGRGHTHSKDLAMLVQHSCKVVARRIQLWVEVPPHPSDLSMQPFSVISCGFLYTSPPSAG